MTGDAQRPRPLVRGRAALVQDRRLLRDPHARVLRRQRRRLGRLPRADREARLPAVARRRLHLAAAVLLLAAARRRLRHRRLLHDPARLRQRRRRARLHRGRAPARHARHRRPRHEPHVERPPVVPGVALEPGQPQARLVRLVRHRAQLRGRADHLHRHGDVELDLGRPGRRLLLAPLLLPPAGPQLRQPRGPGRADRGAALLARPRHGRLPPRRRARTSTSARARTARTCPRRTSTSSACGRRSTPTTPTACCSPRPTSGRPTSSSTSATATSATWPSTSPSCRACSWRCGARRPSPSTRSSTRRRRSRTTASGACSSATTTS